MKETILLVDDNPTNLTLLFSHLRSLDYYVLVADSGVAAVEQCQRVQPDLILLDVRMPGMNGYETCRAIKAIPETSDIPILFLSALSDLDDRLKGFEAGGVDYITKPLNVHEVTARVRTHLKLAQTQRALSEANKQLAGQVQDRTAELALESQQRRTQEQEKGQLLDLLREQYVQLGTITQQLMSTQPLSYLAISQIVQSHLKSALRTIETQLHSATRTLTADGLTEKSYYAQTWQSQQRVRQLQEWLDHLDVKNNPDIPVQRSTETPLSQREEEILSLLCDGLSSDDIGERLSISPVTVRTYRARIMRKLSVDHLPDLVKYALVHGFTTV